VNVKRAALAKTSENGAVIEGVRDKILSTARELFYREGARAIGVDRIVAESGVAKTSLYRWFPSKDDLITAFLEEEEKDRWSEWDRNLARHPGSPEEQLMAQMRGIEHLILSQGFRGCPFINVASEFADVDHPARAVCLRVTQELRSRVRGLIEKLDVRDPARLSDQLVLLIDGAFSAGQILGKDGPCVELENASRALVQAYRKSTAS
jgi:AcrR family transcriptional regulator